MEHQNLELKTLVKAHYGKALKRKIETNPVFTVFMVALGN